MKVDSISNLRSATSPIRSVFAVFFVKLFFSKKFIHKRIEKLYVQYKDDNCSYVGVPAVMAIKKSFFYKIFPKNLFDEYIYLDFEGSSFQCIKHYDQFLKIFYGNYMELPPVEQRVGKHGIVAYFK